MTPGAPEDPAAPEAARSAAGTELRGPWWYPGRRELTEAQRRDVLQQVFFEGADLAPFLRRFSVMLTLALMIAAFGLISDSGPVVIGAMLISPLTTPLMGLCAALVLGQPRRQLRAAALLLAGTLGGIGLAVSIMYVLPEDGARALESAELLARTQPSLMDLLVAVAAGSAGAYVLVRREAIAALPGVAIAVALVPPLATAGITLEVGRSDLADEALLLYLTNLAGIVLAGSVTMLALGVSPAAQDERISRRVKLGLVSAGLAAVLIAAPLAEHTRREINDSHDRESVQRIAREWAKGTGLTVNASLLADDRVAIRATGPERPPAVGPLADAIAEDLDEPVSVTVNYTERVELTETGRP